MRWRNNESCFLLEKIVRICSIDLAYIFTYLPLAPLILVSPLETLRNPSRKCQFQKGRAILIAAQDMGKYEHVLKRVSTLPRVMGAF